MSENPYDHSSTTDAAAEAAYWAAEDRHWDYAAYVEQQALALAEEAETDVEQGD